MLAHFWLILVGALLTSASSIISVWLMRKSGEDRATAFFSSMPGGSGEMVNLGARNGAVLSRVAAGQSLRVLTVVLCVPAAFRYLLGEGAPALQAAPVNKPQRFVGLLWPQPFAHQARGGEERQSGIRGDNDPDCGGAAGGADCR